MRARLALLCALTLGAALAAPLVAQPVPEASGLHTALAHWLAEDEAQALAALAGLAAEGDTPARLMLALIDTTPALQGPTLSLMARPERLALLRAEGGISGQNWLARIEGDPLAEAWRSLRHVDAGPEVIAAFTALGEPRAARQALLTLAAREHPGLAAMALDAVDPDLLFALWPGADATRRDDILRRIPEGDGQRARLGLPLTDAAFAQWLAASAAAAPLAALCAMVCPEAQPPCHHAAYAALGSHDALLTLGSPVESLIPQAQFLASPRGRATVLRRILLAVPMAQRRAMVSQVAIASPCLAEALRDEAHRHRPTPPRATESEG